jgi:hypothetical protein
MEIIAVREIIPDLPPQPFMGGVGSWEVLPKKIGRGVWGQLREICGGHPLSGTCLKPDIPDVGFMGN